MNENQYIGHGGDGKDHLVTANENGETVNVEPAPKSFAERIIENVEVRRHNGQCAYGDWLPVDDDAVPSWVGDMVGDEIAENDDDSGRIESGGETWLWRK